MILISPRNYFLYTPLLPAVATGTMEGKAVISMMVAQTWKQNAVSRLSCLQKRNCVSCCITCNALAPIEKNKVLVSQTIVYICVSLLQKGAS